jgi:phosphate-selective porin OprO/OprP
VTPGTRRRARGAATSAVAALLICLGATWVSADPATPPIDSSTAAPEPTASESPSSGPGDVASETPQEVQPPAENPPKPEPPAQQPSDPTLPKTEASKSEDAPDAESKRKKEILDDQFEELSEDAPAAGGAPPEAEEPDPPPEKPVAAVDDAEAPRADDSRPDPSDDVPTAEAEGSADDDSAAPLTADPEETPATDEPEPPSLADSEAPSKSESEPHTPTSVEPTTQDGVKEQAPQAATDRTAHETFEELTEDAPRAKSDTSGRPGTSDKPDRSAEDKVPTPDAPPAETAAVEPEGKQWRNLNFRWHRGLRIESKDKKLRIKVGGRLFVDVASISGDAAIESRFETGGFIDARQARIDITGTWGSSIYYRLQVDLTGKSSTGRSRNEYIKSLFVGYVAPSWLGRVELGVVKEPFSMGILTSGLNLDFLERGLPTLFAPSFNPGILIRNEAFDDRLFWAFGVFRFFGSNGDKHRVDVTARVGGVPWSSEDGKDFLHLGASYAALFGSDFGLEIGSRPETFFGDKWVQASGVNAKNGHLFGVELAGAWKGFSYQSEIILSMANRLSDDDLLFWGAYAQVSYFITGEQRRYLKRQGVFGRVAINHAFSWKKRTWGAWELTARYSYLDLDDVEVRGGIMNDFTLGLNWYILPNVRAMANYVHAHVNGLGTGHVFSTRFQIDF